VARTLSTSWQQRSTSQKHIFQSHTRGLRHLHQYSHHIFPNGIPIMYDIFTCSQSLHKQVHDCKAVPHGTVSDHKAVRLSLKFRSHALSRGTIDWPKILPDDHTHVIYNEHLLMLMTEPTQWAHCYHSQAPMRRLVPNEPLYPCSTICQAQHPQTCSQAHEPALPCNPIFDAIQSQTSYLSHHPHSVTPCPRQHGMQSYVRRSMTYGSTHT